MVDYTNFGDGKALDTATIQKRWWKSNKTDRAQAIYLVVKSLSEWDSKRQTQYQISTRLYGNAAIMGISGFSFSKLAQVNSSMKERISYNIVQSCTDTVTAKIAKNKPRPMFLTSGGDAGLQKKAKNLTKFCDGVFYENEAYTKGTRAFLDGCILGDGLIQVYEREGRVKWERAYASEMYVDWMEAFYGNPRQLHRVKNVDREVLIDMFPEKAHLIRSANSAQGELSATHPNIADQITVIESWHLRSGKDATDGMHCISIAEGMILEEEYDWDEFPFAKFTWCDRMFGFWGQGGVEQIQNIQLEVNKLLWIIQRSYHLAGSFKVFLEMGSKIVKEHLSNDIGAIVNYQGTPPQYVVPPIVAGEIYGHLENLVQKAFEQYGISQLSAGSKKPEGLDSGKALREYNNIETERFMVIGQRYEKFFLDLARLSIKTAKCIYEREGSYSVKVPAKRFVDEIDWKDIDMEEDQYVMQCFPVSSLPEEPAGRLQTIQEYIQAGMLTPRVGKMLLDFPDLDAVENRSNAKEEYLIQILERMIDEEDLSLAYTAPEPEDELGSAMELALEFYAQAKMNNVPEERLELLRQFMSQVRILQQGALQGAQQAAAPAGPGQDLGAPQAAPMAPPQSDLIPNAPGIAG